MLHLWPLCQQWCSAGTWIMQLQWPSACELHRTSLIELLSWYFCARWHKPLASNLSLPVTSHESAAWLLMRKLRAERPVVLLRRSLCLCFLRCKVVAGFYSSLHIYFDGSGGYTSAETPQMLATEYMRVVTNRNVSLIHSWITYSIWASDSIILFLQWCLCPFLFFVSVLVKAVQNEDLDGWSFYLWERD